MWVVIRFILLIWLCLITNWVHSVALLQYLQLYSPGPSLNLILVVVFVRLQLLISGLVLILVLVVVVFVVQVQAALLVQVVPGHELRALAGAPLGQLVHAVTQSRGWRRAMQSKHH